MQNLTFVGLSDDGSALILTSGDGNRFRLPIDERLRSATRGGRTSMDVSDGPVTARDIQARLRAGATPTEVAEFSGWAIDRVEAFAAPVLQERGYIAQKAQACAIGRGEDDPGLGEVVAQRLAERGIDEDSIRWDSWRRDDGLWTVLLAYPAGKGDRVATWSFDIEAGSLAAEDDEARWFLTEGLPEADRPRLLTVPNDDEPVAQRPSFAGNHPAGRAQQRAPHPANDENERPAPARTEPQPNPAQPQSQPDIVQPELEGPRWDEVLFGSPRDDFR